MGSRFNESDVSSCPDTRGTPKKTAAGRNPAAAEGVRVLGEVSSPGLYGAVRPVDWIFSKI